MVSNTHTHPATSIPTVNPDVRPAPGVGEDEYEDKSTGAELTCRYKPYGMAFNAITSIIQL